MLIRTHNHQPWLVIGLILSLHFFWLACSKKPQTVQELFPEITFDERATAKQFAVVATGSEPMIDDLEDGDLNGLKVDGRNWSWAQFDDMTDGIQVLTIEKQSDGPRQGSNTLYIKGGGWQKIGAGVSASLVHKVSPRMYGYYDASIFSGISFWVKAQQLNTLTVSIGSPETTHVNDGGRVTDPLPGNFSFSLSVSETWTQVKMPFDQFLLSRGEHQLAVDPKRIKGIHFAFGTSQDYKVWLDDLIFYE